MELKAFILAFALFSSVKAQYGSCDYSATIATVGGSIPLNHATSTAPCRYQITTPANTFITAQCTLNLKDTSCNSRFLVSRSGNKNLIDYIPYCTSGTITVSSIGNEIVVVIAATATYPAGFSCTFKSVALDNTNCDCGWVGIPKIVGGVNTNINEYIAHAGLQYIPSSEVYCGGVIRELDHFADLRDAKLIFFHSFTNSRYDCGSLYFRIPFIRRQHKNNRRGLEYFVHH